MLRTKKMFSILTSSLFLLYSLKAIAENHASPKEPAGSPNAQRPVDNESPKEKFDKLNAQIAELKTLILEKTRGRTVISGEAMSYYAQPPKQFKIQLEGMANFERILKAVLRNIGDGKFPEQVVSEIAIVDENASTPLLGQIGRSGNLRLSTQQSDLELQDVMAKLPSKQNFDKQRAEAIALERKLSRLLNSIYVSANGGQPKSLQEELAGLRTAEKLLPQLNLVPHVIQSVSIVNSGASPHASYSDFMKSFSIWPGETLEEAKKALAVVPLTPTTETFTELAQITAAAKSPQLQRMLDKISVDLKKVDVSAFRLQTTKQNAITDRLGIQGSDVQAAGTPEQQLQLLDRLARLDPKQVPAEHAIRWLSFSSHVKSPGPLLADGVMKLPAGASDEMIISSLRKAPKLKDFEAEADKMKDRTFEVAGKFARGGRIAVYDVSHDDVFKVAAMLDGLAAKGYKLKAPATGFYILDYDPQHPLTPSNYFGNKAWVSVNAGVTEKGLIDSGFVVKGIVKSSMVNDK